MNVTHTIYTSFPNTIGGKRYADDYETQARQVGIFRERKEDTTKIVIKTETWVEYGKIERGRAEK